MPLAGGGKSGGHAAPSAVGRPPGPRIIAGPVSLRTRDAHVPPGTALRHRPTRSARLTPLRLGLGRRSSTRDRGSRASRHRRWLGAPPGGELRHGARRRGTRASEPPACTIVGIRGHGLRGPPADSQAFARTRLHRRQLPRHRYHGVAGSRPLRRAQVARGSLARERRVAPPASARFRRHRPPRPRPELYGACARRRRSRCDARAAPVARADRDPFLRPQHGRRRQSVSANTDRRPRRRGSWRTRLHVQPADAGLSPDAPRSR